MTLDFAKLLDTPIYDRLGVAATVTAKSGQAASFTLLDKTLEGEKQLGELVVPTQEPAFAIRLSELAEKGWTRADLKEAEILVEATLYRVFGTHPLGNRRELRLYLTELE